MAPAGRRRVPARAPGSVVKVRFAALTEFNPNLPKVSDGNNGFLCVGTKMKAGWNYRCTSKREKGVIEFTEIG